jgi:hypothetical protein
MTAPLKKGAQVTLLDVPDKPQLEVCRVGIAGFQAKGLGRTYWWQDRGKTWSSVDLDRIDSVKQQFREAAASREAK